MRMGGDGGAGQNSNRALNHTMVAYRNGTRPDMKGIALRRNRTMAGCIERYIGPDIDIVANAHLPLIQNGQVLACKETLPNMNLAPIIAMEGRHDAGIGTATAQNLTQQSVAGGHIRHRKRIVLLAKRLATEHIHQQRRVVGEIVLARNHLFFDGLHGWSSYK